LTGAPWGIKGAGAEGSSLSALLTSEGGIKQIALAGGVVVGTDVGHHGGFEEVALAPATGEDRRALVDRAAHLLLQAVGRGFGGERSDRRIRRARVARLHGADRRCELLQEGLVELVDDDESLAGVAGLPGVLQPGFDGRLDDLSRSSVPSTMNGSRRVK
jgi:hypothetical protein